MTDRSSSWSTRPADAFGRLLIRPDELGHVERIEALRGAAGRALASADPALHWVGRGLLAWLDGHRVEDAFGVRPPRGSKRTVARLAAQRERDAALLRLASAAGSDRLALQWLRGEPCPPEHEHLLDAAHRLGCPTGASAVSRARTASGR